ncbi:NAD(P)H-quinone oxidoreductase [Endozoicomonas arenosclerae]|uniref:NAD(P)H-quinone oxidoreductase n=1 Tax=Endozoicomonas arenosclerae TaxID=1633495 RepID=UPI0007855DCB|nr:NAD(P)H-quinone oxidoreductase [Endozoicomonas arenosclerae]
MQDNKGFHGLVAIDKALHWRSFPDEPLGKDQVKVRVVAAGLNRADLSQRAGTYNPPPGVTPVLGLECAGVIEAVGENVSQWLPGQQVCALLPGGGLATDVVCDQRLLLPVPESLSLLEAAGIVEVYATAWLNLFHRGGVKPGDKVLLMAGASGVGTAAIQLCAHFGLEATVVVGSDEKLQFCRDLGALNGINRHEQDWEALKAFGPFDMVLDCCAGDWLEKYLRLMNTGGRIVTIGLMAGRKGQLDMGLLLMKRIQVMGSTLRFLPITEKESLLSELKEKVWPLFAQGKLKTVVDTVLPMEEYQKAYDLMASNKTTGKVIMSLPV